MAKLKDDWTYSIRLSAALASPDFSEAESCLLEARDRKVVPALLYEITLQSYLFLGYPRAIEGLKRLRAAYPDFTPPPSEKIDSESSLSYIERGERLCRRVYGDNYESLRAAISNLSPELDYWMVWEGYGKVLSRGDVDPELRELCTLAALAVTGDIVQFHSHLRGALNMGAEPEHIRAALAIVEDLTEPQRFSEATALAERVLRKVSK